MHSASRWDRHRPIWGLSPTCQLRTAMLRTVHPAKSCALISVSYRTSNFIVGKWPRLYQLAAKWSPVWDMWPLESTSASCSKRSSSISVRKYLAPWRRAVRPKESLVSTPAWCSNSNFTSSEFLEEWWTLDSSWARPSGKKLTETYELGVSQNERVGKREVALTFHLQCWLFNL